VQDYYADHGIEIHDMEWLPTLADTCEGCECAGGSVMFLTPADDRADVLLINFWTPRGLPQAPLPDNAEPRAWIP